MCAGKVERFQSGTDDLLFHIPSPGARATTGFYEGAKSLLRFLCDDHGPPGGRVVSHPVNAVLEPAARESDVATAVSPATGGSMSYRDITLSLHDDMAELETDWRRFEQHADCTVFQSFDWLSLWCRHIGKPADVRPAIVAGRDKAGALVFLMPLAVTPGLLRRLTFLGDGLCDYNAPLLAPGFAAALDAASFRAL